MNNNNGLPLINEMSDVSPYQRHYDNVVFPVSCSEPHFLFRESFRLKDFPVAQGSSGRTADIKSDSYRGRDIARRSAGICPDNDQRQVVPFSYTFQIKSE